MLDPEQFRRLVIRPVVRRLGLWSPAAERLLLGTALTESGLRHLHQVRGPARGLYQIEPATLRDLYANWLPRRPALAEGLGLFTAPHGALDDQLIWNLAYASAVARLIYCRVPEPLPRADDLAALAEYWKAHFNTAAGKGAPADFIARAGPLLRSTRRSLGS
jgi:hypothetical protein